MYWNRFDICEAYYVYGVLWHAGQSSYGYAKLSQLRRMCFVPRFSLSSENMNENATEIYNALVEKHEKGAHV